MFTLNDIIAATNGRLIQGGVLSRAAGVSIDSRTTKKNDVFIAIKGERFDGHRFAGKAVEKGASILVVERKVRVPGQVTVILVKDTTKALGRLAHYHRCRFRIPVIAITGSSGKTTVKEMTAAVLQNKYRVLKNVVTQNNHIGVPLTLFRLTKRHQVAVLEFGTNRPGDIRWLTQIAVPNVAVLLNIGESHLEFLRTPKGVLNEKMDIVRYAPDDVTVILNNDDVYLRDAGKKAARNIVTFGVRHKADYRAESIRCRDLTHLQFKINPGGTFVLKTPGEHNVYNAIAAISCGRHFRIRYNDIKNTISRFSAPSGRQRFLKIGSWRVIDDTYNANPVSVRGAIGTLRCLPARGQKVLVCSDMLELGIRSKPLHREMGRYAAQSDLDLLLTVGPWARWMTAGAKEANPRMRAFHCSSVRQLCAKLKKQCAPGDVILVKGSRRMAMERVINFLEKQAAA